jgi:hypothetical protein
MVWHVIPRNIFSSKVTKCFGSIQLTGSGYSPTPMLNASRQVIDFKRGSGRQCGSTIRQFVPKTEQALGKGWEDEHNKPVTAHRRVCDRFRKETEMILERHRTQICRTILLPKLPAALLVIIFV